MTAPPVIPIDDPADPRIAAATLAAVVMRAMRASLPSMASSPSRTTA